MATVVELERQLRLIDELDLEPIEYKLVHPEPGESGITVVAADRLTLKYRRFLKLCAMYPERGIVPSKELDPVWHAHILDTAKYYEDCMKVFGFVLHHFPYLGSRGPEDVLLLKQKFAETCALYKQHFGEELLDGAADGAPAYSICKSICDGGGCETDPDGGPGNPFTGNRARPRLARTA